MKDLMKQRKVDIDGSSMQENPRKFQKRKQKPYDNGDHSSLPGVQKIKAALRQTRRLLAKDNLAADVRIETERRLKSLEADLEQAELTRKERDLAVKYHKVKFFERQKVTRKIKQVKRQLASDEQRSKKSTAPLENALFELRVDLNYILHYPKLEKYISLFPSTAETEEASESTSCTVAVTVAKRQSIREQIRKDMQEGVLRAELENDLEKDEAPGKAVQRRAFTAIAKDARTFTKAPLVTKGRDQGQNTAQSASGDIGADDFFYEASDEE